VPGEVVVQTFSPDHYAIEAAARQNYPAFYEQEIAFREELGYPPFSRLVNIVSSDPVSEYAEEKLGELAQGIRERISGESVEILGPATAPLSKLKGLYRWHLLLKDRSQAADNGLQRIIRAALDEMPSSAKTGLILDVDPLSML
jgi:primosomal protein N' (replication factor Y)